jgi:hypothetical protein
MQAIDAWRVVLLVHAAATLFLTGLIWFVQVVHYPLLGHVGDASLPGYAQHHARLTTFVVAPAMLIETLTAAAIVALGPPSISFTAAAAGAGLLVVVWLSTALLQVPRHARLQRTGKPAISGLVATNWVRTCAWSVRSILALGMI